MKPMTSRSRILSWLLLLVAAAFLPVIEVSSLPSIRHQSPAAVIDRGTAKQQDNNKRRPRDHDDHHSDDDESTTATTATSILLKQEKVLIDIQSDVPVFALPDDVSLLSQQQEKQHQVSTSSSSSTQTNNNKRQETFISCMAVLSGVVDVITFKKFGYYCNMMTGNSIKSMTALAENRFTDVMLHGSLIVFYAVGVAIYKYMDAVILLSSDKNNCRWVGLVAFVLFCASDAFESSLAKLPFLAAAFGIINSFVLTSTGTVINAATGHLTRATMGSVEQVMMNSRRRKGASSSMGVGVGGSSSSSIAATRRAARFFTLFLLGVLTTTLLYNAVDKLPYHIQAMLDSLPLETSLGFIHLVLLGWYSQ